MPKEQIDSCPREFAACLQEGRRGPGFHFHKQNKVVKPKYQCDRYAVKTTQLRDAARLLRGNARKIGMSDCGDIRFSFGDHKRF